MFVLQGLLNPLGLNICYMNSTFQCIAACNINVGGNEAQGSLSSLLSGILQHIVQRLGPDHLSAINTLKEHLPVFNNNDQQDAFHFLEELVSATAREGNKFGRCVNFSRNHVYIMCCDISLASTPCSILDSFCHTKCSSFTGTTQTQTVCKRCKQWSSPNQPDPLVGVSVSCTEDEATIHDSLQWEWTPVEGGTDRRQRMGLVVSKKKHIKTCRVTSKIQLGPYSTCHDDGNLTGNICTWIVEFQMF